MAYPNVNFGQLFDKLENAEIKDKIRLYEKTKKRILLAKYGILFNKICLDVELYPIFTNIYIIIYIYVYIYINLFFI